MRIILLDYSCRFKVGYLFNGLDTPYRSALEFADSSSHSSDPMLNQVIIATWKNICHATGHGFEPYLPVVMPLIINAVSLKDDATVYGR
jgi:hypothetical protein